MTAFLLITWLIRTIGSLPPVTYYWQLKEYRWDRMREFLLQQGGHQYFFSVFHVSMTVALLLGFVGKFLIRNSSVVEQWFPALVTIFLLAESLQFLHQLWQGNWKRPRRTGKAFAILGISFLLELGIVALVLTWTNFEASAALLATVLALLVLFEHDLHALVVFAMNALSNIIKRHRYRAAQRKRLAHGKLKVVGITGSYGKTSVKDYLAHLLEGSFKVLKTPKNTNTEIGIAHTILKDLRSDHDVFVCEMGAYKMGEIKLCCLMARPQIGIFTGLNEQHVALFGSIDNTFQAKWELFSSLPPDGVAIFNADSEQLLSRIKPLKGQTVLCSTSGDDTELTAVEVKSSSLHFTYKGQAFVAPLIGAFQIVNILMALKAAEALGVTLPVLAERVATLQAPEKTMELYPFGGGVILDDSYNVNTDGLRAALEHMKLFEHHKKILFFPGILELGSKMESIHESLGEDIGKAVDMVFFTDPHFSEPLIRGALKGGLTRSDIDTSDDPQLMIQHLEVFMEAHDEPVVILFESRGAEKVMESLLKN